MKLSRILQVNGLELQSFYVLHHFTATMSMAHEFNPFPRSQCHRRRNLYPCPENELYVRGLE